MSIPSVVTSEILDAALKYVERGWRVFPCHSVDEAGRCTCGNAACGSPGKHPRTAHGVKDATPNAEHVRSFFAGGDCNIGLATGSVSGLGVVDIDVKVSDGRETLRKLEEAHGALPGTPMVLTPSGGCHLYFEIPAGVPVKNSVQKIGPGLDIRGDGGYVIAPPSRGANGRAYNFEISAHIADVPIAPLPAWLLEKIAASRVETNGHGSQGEKIPAGYRNAALAAFAGAMRQKGASQEAIAAALLAENHARCAPPLAEAEVRKIADSISRYKAGDSFEHLTDLGNALRFTKQHGENLKFCHDCGGWFVWTGQRWVVDRTGEVFRLAKDTVRAIYQEAAAQENPKIREAIAGWAVRSESEARIKSMTSLAKSEKIIAVRPDDLDADPWLLNVSNGTIDLRTGIFRDAKREDLITKMASVVYDRAAACPKFEAFLQKIFHSSEDLVRYIQKILGYCLTGSVAEKAFFYFHGKGDNGKTTLMNTLLALVGEYGKTAAPDLLIFKNNSDHPTELADLKDARLVISSEADDGKRFAEALLKRLTGRNKIKGRYMRADFFEFAPTHKIFIDANYKLEIRGRDPAIWGRVKLIPCDVQISKAEQVKDYERVLGEELSGILNFALEGLRLWHDEGLGDPPEVTKAVDEYQHETDFLVDFLEEECVTAQNAQCLADDLWKEYIAWADKAGERHPATRRVFKNALEQRGFRRERGTSGAEKGRWKWRGIGLLDSNGRSSDDKELEKKVKEAGLI